MFACWVKILEEEEEKIVYIVQLCMDSYIVQKCIRNYVRTWVKSAVVLWQKVAHLKKDFLQF